MWNYIVQIIRQKRGQHIEGSPTPEEQQQDPRAGIGNERKQFHKTMGPDDIASADMLTDTDALKNAAASYGGEAGGGTTGAIEMAAAGDTVSVPQGYTAPAGASGVFELGGGGGLPQSTAPPTVPAESIAAPQPTGLYYQPEVKAQTVDAFGGQEYGDKAVEAVRKTDPAIGEYIENALKNYARNKVGKKIGRQIDTVADFTNLFGENNETDTGKQIQALADWFAGGDRKTRDKKRRAQGLYGY